MNAKKNTNVGAFSWVFGGLCFDGGGFFSLFLKYLRREERGRLHCVFSHFTTQDFELCFFSLSFELSCFEGPFLPSLLHPAV